MATRQRVWFALCLLLAVSSSTAKVPSAQILRALEDEGYEYQAIEDLSPYQMKFGNCVHVKVPEDNDDEGNSYFYNGHYYSMTQQFASVFLCEEDFSEEGEEDGSEGLGYCGVCDTSIEYVTDLASYLEITLEYAQEMCQSCSAMCYGRQLEDDGDDGDVMIVDCNSCQETCAKMTFSYNNENENNNNVDETMYLECQAVAEDEDGNEIYAGPQCNSAGQIVIGFFYDDECIIKSSSQEIDLGLGDFNTFRGIEQMCVLCDAYGNGDGDSCEELYQDSTHCSHGSTLNGDNDNDLPICKTYEKVHKEHWYAGHKKRWRIVETVFGVVLFVGLFWGFLTLSYTYYLRHRRSSHKDATTALADQDHQAAAAKAQEAKSDLPPVS